MKRSSALTPTTLKNSPKTVVPCNADDVQTVISQCPEFTSIHESMMNDIYSFAHGTTLSMKQSSDNIVK